MNVKRKFTRGGRGGTWNFGTLENILVAFNRKPVKDVNEARSQTHVFLLIFLDFERSEECVLILR